MHYQKLQCLAIAGFLSIAAASSSTIHVKGHHDPEIVQNLYKKLGTFNLDEKLFGPDARLSELLISNSTDDHQPAFPVSFDSESLDDTDGQSPAFPVSFDTDSLDDTEDDLALLRRAPCYSLERRKCTEPPKFENKLISYEQQVWLTGYFCDWVADIAPYAVSIAGMKVTGLICGERLTYRCNGVLTIISTTAGKKIGPGIKRVCQPSYDALISECDKTGGQQTVKVKKSGTEFIMEEITSTDDGNPCPFNDDNARCTLYDCNGDCHS